MSRKTMVWYLAAFAGILLLLASSDLPDWADPHAPEHEGKAGSHFIEQTYEETTVPNLVTAVLADYRGYDTMFETVVIFIAGLAIMAILGFQDGWDSGARAIHIDFVRHDGHLHLDDDIIVRITCRLLIPALQLFAFYVVAHGHHSPGGGFQGGVILGTSFILIALSRELHHGLDFLPPKRMLLLAALGIVIYAGTGLLCLLLGSTFLDYAQLAEILPMGPKAARSLSMLIVEIGVAFTVSTIMFGIFAHLSTRGTLDEGL